MSDDTVKKTDFGDKNTPDIFIERSKTGFGRAISQELKLTMAEEMRDKELLSPELLSPDPVKQKWVDEDHQANISLSANENNQAPPFNPNVKTINRADRGTIKSVMSIPDEDNKSQIQMR